MALPSTKRPRVHAETVQEKLEEARADIEWYRSQLDTLAVDPPAATPEQLTRLFNGILRGEDWRHGTWR